MEITIEAHPLLDAAFFVSTWPNTLGRTPSFADLLDRFGQEKPPMESSDLVRLNVRDLLRHGGFKPTGRSKPASEYLLKARTNDRLGGINAAVDTCNVVSLHSGLPISVVDLDKTRGAIGLAIAPPETRYIFNPSGQEIDVSGLICLFDARGPIAGPVKDSQATKTHDGTVSTLSIVWGTVSLPGRTQAAVDWYQSLTVSLGGQTSLTP